MIKYILLLTILLTGCGEVCKCPVKKVCKEDIMFVGGGIFLPYTSCRCPVKCIVEKKDTLKERVK